MILSDIEFETLDALVEKYSAAIPRYTSYPTAVEFNSDVDSDLWLESLHRFSDADQNEPKRIALYCHIPFCKTLCYYCACNKKITKDRSVVAPYLEALSIEIKTIREALSDNHQVEQIHWGGGTPNYLTAEESESLYETIISEFPNIDSNADISVEVDPRTVTAKLIKTYRALGFNRISLGVQDFDRSVQEVVNRVQSYEETQNVIEKSREAGISSVNVDLMYGLPNQELDSFKETIDQVVALKPERIALYGYAHVTWRKKAQKSFHRYALPSPKLRISLFLAALRILRDAGYRYIGMDHFALPNDELRIALDNGSLNRNFMGYTTHRDASVLGFGASAISSLPTMYAQNATDVGEYEERIAFRGVATARGITCSKDDIVRREIIEGILCRGKVDLSYIQKHEIAIPEAQLQELVEDGLVELTESELVVTALGRLFLRNIAACFDAYLANHRLRAKPVFSQSV